MVVGFHHKKGSQVEYVYPPLPNSQPDETGTQSGIILPPAWRDLPSLALPDGAHKYDNDTVYFHIPSTDEPKRTIFAVSCLMQVESSHFKEKDQSVTRSSVLKSICVLSAVPLFGLISSKVALATQVWFHQEDFNDVDLLKDLYKSLTVAVPAPVCPDISILSIDLDIRGTISKFGKKLIRLFKVLLLEPRIMFLIEPTADMSRVILGFLSLYPGMLEKGLLLSGVSPHIAPPQTPANNSSSPRFSFSSTEQVKEPANGNPEAISTPRSKFDPSSVQTSIDLISHSLQSDQYGLPLAIFGPENACLPYVSVSFLERLPLLSSYLIGCTNILYLHKCECDIVIQYENQTGNSNQGMMATQSQQQQQPNGALKMLKIDFKDKLLKKIVKPTQSDLKFIGWIMKTVEMDSKSSDPYFAGSNWVASDEWIREQFKLYLLGLFACVAHDNEKYQESYGATFIAAWKRKLNYSVWLRTIDREHYAGFLHPGDDPTAAGNFVVSSNIFGSSSLASLSGATATAAQISSKAVSKAADSAKKFLFSRAGGLMSSVLGSGGGGSSQTPPAKGSEKAETGQKKPHSASVSADLSVHVKNNPAPGTPPAIQRIDDRGGEASSLKNEYVIIEKKDHEDESQL